MTFFEIMCLKLNGFKKSLVNTFFVEYFQYFQIHRHTVTTWAALQSKISSRVSVNSIPYSKTRFLIINERR